MEKASRGKDDQKWTVKFTVGKQGTAMIGNKTDLKKLDFKN